MEFDMGKVSTGYRFPESHVKPWVVPGKNLPYHPIALIVPSRSGKVSEIHDKKSFGHRAFLSKAKLPPVLQSGEQTFQHPSITDRESASFFQRNRAGRRDVDFTIPC